MDMKTKRQCRWQHKDNWQERGQERMPGERLKIVQSENAELV
jgi:hypothetical protein